MPNGAMAAASRPSRRNVCPSIAVRRARSTRNRGRTQSMPDVTVPQWAAQIGISKQAAYKRLKSGKVTLNSRGLIDTESAAAQWEANKDVRQWQRGAPK